MRSTQLEPAGELRGTGLRVTGQRVLILRIIRRSGEHLDVDEIWAAARAQDATVSLATVYRTVQALKRAGLVEQRYFGPAHARDHYEKVGGPEHYHFTCVRCGRVFEFETALSRRLRADLHARNGWKVAGAILSLEGTCAECASDNGS